MTRPKRPQPALPGIGGDGKRAVARMRRTADQSLRALPADPIDAGLVGLYRTLADTLDAEVTDPEPNRWTIGALAGRFLATHVALRGERDVASDAGYDAELAALVAALRDAKESRPSPSSSPS